MKYLRKKGSKIIVVNSDYKSLSKLIGVIVMIITVGFSVLVVLGIMFAKPIILLQTKPNTPPNTIESAVVYLVKEVVKM